jgi:hypothetical protein
MERFAPQRVGEQDGYKIAGAVLAGNQQRG